MIANPSYYGRDPNAPDRDLPLGTVTSVESMEYVVPIKRIAWGAVLAGVVLAIGVLVLLNMLGTGIGASTIDPLRGDTPDAEVLGISAAMWWILSSLIALFVGGWTAARLAGIPRQVDGMLHGSLDLGSLLLSRERRGRLGRWHVQFDQRRRRSCGPPGSRSSRIGSRPFVGQHKAA